MDNSILNCSVSDNLNFTTNSTVGNITTGNAIGATGTSCWHYWTDHWYPEVIHATYPVYIQERAKDKGKQAYELLKMLKDKRFINIEKVGDFIDLMDELIKIL